MFVSNTNLSSFENLLRELKQTSVDLFTSNIVVVPDKFTMNAERLIFERLNIDSIFNIEVMSLTRFANKVLENRLRDVKILTKQSGVMLVSKILFDMKENLNLFKTLYQNVGVSETIYETISQLKSSGISPEEFALSKNQKTNLGIKVSDISLIYSEYERQMTTTLIDAITRLDILCNEVKNSDLIKKSNIYFGMFDDFTFKQLTLLSHLAKYSKSFSLSLSATTLQNNKNIYLNETFQKVLGTLKSSGIEVKIINSFAKLPKSFNHIVQNLFSLSHPFETEDKSVVVVEAENHLQEIEFVARKVKELVMEGKADPSCINIACADFSRYSNDISSIFNQYKIPFYQDYSKPLSEHFYAGFILNLCEVISTNFAFNPCMEYVKSNFIDISASQKEIFENYCVKYGIDHTLFLKEFKRYGEEEYSQAEEVRKQIFSSLSNLKNDIKNAGTINEYTKILRNFLDDLNVKETLTAVSLNDRLEAGFKKATGQVYDKINEILRVLEEVLGKTKTSFECFVSILTNGISSSTISSIPLGVENVFVGDLSTSSFYPADYMFIIGATEGNCPRYQNDCGIITDTEIEQLQTKNQLNPSIRFINKKERFKLFNLTALSGVRLFVSYSNLVAEQQQKPSELIENLQNLFLLKSGEKLPLLKLANELLYIESTDSREHMRQYAHVFSTLKNTYRLTQNFSSKNRYIGTAKDIVKKELSGSVKNGSEDFTLKNADNIFFSKGTVSVSQIEKYFACPYLHFVNYGLRLKEREVYGIKSLDVGNILHRVAEVFVRHYIKNGQKEVSAEEIKEITDRVFAEQEEQGIINPHNDKLKINSLKKESVKLCNNLQNNFKISEFRPMSAEITFNNFQLKSGLNLKGKVDRIDIYDKYFAIFDYKTGREEFSLKDAFYGNKIQILVYLSVIEITYGLVPAGAFYLPVKNTFGSDSKTGGRAVGIFLNAQNIIDALDSNIKADSYSGVYKIKYKQDGTLDMNTLKHALSTSEINNLKGYVIEVFNNAVNEIMEGNILPSPTKNVCTYCPYRAMCGFDYEEQGERRQDADITKSSFMRGGEVNE